MHQSHDTPPLTIIFIDNNTITFPRGFNGPLKPNSLPSVKKIILNPCYRQKIEKHVIPSTVTHLILGDGYDQEIEADVLPNSIIYLSLGDNYSHKFKPNVIPSSVKELTLGKKFIFDKESVISDSITNLYLYYGNYRHDISMNLRTNIHFYNYGNFNHFSLRNKFYKNCDYIDANYVFSELIYSIIDCYYDKYFDYSIFGPRISYTRDEDKYKQRIVSIKLTPINN
jgi:hypothetical protein